MPKSPLAAIETLESNAFRVSQLARRLRAEHRTLRVDQLQASAFSSTSYDRAMSLEITAPDVANARGWAEALGIEVTTKLTTYPASGGGYQSVTGEGRVDGVVVALYGGDMLTSAELAAAQAAEAAAVQQ